MEKSNNLTKIALRIDNDELNKLDYHVDASNSRSRYAFIIDAIKFYCGYLDASDNYYLPTAIKSTMEGSLQSAEDRISRLLFKNTVEVSMMMNLFAHAVDVEEDTLNKLRQKCLNDVKKTNGKIDFKEINRYQNG